MREPDDLTAWIDAHGDTWVRVDEVAGWLSGDAWRCLCDGPNWESWATPGGCRDWAFVSEYGPFTQADPQRTADAIDEVLRMEGAR